MTFALWFTITPCVATFHCLLLSHRTLPQHWVSIRKSLWLVKSIVMMGKPILQLILVVYCYFTPFCLYATHSYPSTGALTETKSSGAFPTNAQSFLSVALCVSYVFIRMWFNTWSLVVESPHLHRVRRVGQQRVFDSTRVIVFGQWWCPFPRVAETNTAVLTALHWEHLDAYCSSCATESGNNKMIRDDVNFACLWFDVQPGTNQTKKHTHMHGTN